MNCAQFQEIIGMRCNPMGQAIEVLTPFTFADGNGIELFAQSLGQQVLFFDDGLTLQHLDSVGVRLGSSKKRWKPLKTIAGNYGVTLSDDGVFETLCPASHASQGFASIVSTILGVAAWEREQAGVALDATWLVDEVALYLKAWKPDARQSEKPSVNGFSGRLLTFDFEMDGQYIDAIQPHSASTGAELRKIVDLNSAPNYVNKDVLVIIDDRLNADAAKQEAGIIGRVAEVWPMTKLIAASGATYSRQ